MDCMSKPPHLIRIKSKEQFDWLIDHLVTETNRASDHWHLCRGLDAACGEYLKEIETTPVFWELTIRAHQDSVVLRLARLFDPAATALSIVNFLETIHRGVTNRTLAPLGLDVAGLDMAAIQDELRIVSDSDPLVSRLLEVRNDYLAHRNHGLVSCGSFSSLPVLREEEIQTLLSRALQIGEKYRRLYGRMLPARGLLGLEDYKRMLSLIRLGLRGWDAERIRRIIDPG
jgi:hypothetical protein